MVPETDLFLARQRGLQFYVSGKEGPRLRWTRVASLSSLDEAAAVAQEQVGLHYEVAIFVESVSGGFLYWSSKQPELYNSLVLREGYS